MDLPQRPQDIGQPPVPGGLNASELQLGPPVGLNKTIAPSDKPEIHRLTLQQGQFFTGAVLNLDALNTLDVVIDDGGPVTLPVPPATAINFKNQRLANIQMAIDPGNPGASIAYVLAGRTLTPLTQHAQDVLEEDAEIFFRVSITSALLNNLIEPNWKTWTEFMRTTAAFLPAEQPSAMSIANDGTVYLFYPTQGQFTIHTPGASAQTVGTADSKVASSTFPTLTPPSFFPWWSLTKKWYLAGGGAGVFAIYKDGQTGGASFFSAFAPWVGSNLAAISESGRWLVLSQPGAGQSRISVWQGS